MTTTIWFALIPIFSGIGYLLTSRLIRKKNKAIIIFILISSALLQTWFFDIEPPWEISMIRESGAILPSWGVLLGWAFHWLALGSAVGFTQPNKSFKADGVPPPP